MVDNGAPRTDEYRLESVCSISGQKMMLCTSSSSDGDLCSTTRASASEVCWVFFQDMLVFFSGYLDGFYFIGLGL